LTLGCATFGTLKGKARINARIICAQVGNFGDCKPVGEGVSEMRVDVWPGYRVYFMRSGFAIYMLLAGGDKSTQAKDIKRAIALANELRDMRWRHERKWRRRRLPQR
jgi:putative addiction module killer protein